MSGVAVEAEPAVLGSPDLAPPARTLIDILCATAAEHAAEPALEDGDGALTYAELTRAVERLARALAARGIGPGARIGVRLPSGSRHLYLAILAVLMAGAAYVPVDADDPDERADLVFGEAGVTTVITDATYAALNRPRPPLPLRGPGIGDDAWIIFTSGSTGVPKGVAVTHRSAAAFVDAEAGLFVPGARLGPGDRVLAGLSVAFDASCEEMWLAWRHGACLVPAPRSLVRSGVDLGAWLVDQRITVVSTVPTLAALWPLDALDQVRLLIFGGEACPPELADRLTDDGREVWNTYGPTEATVVACAAQLSDGEPVRIGLPLDGWLLAVVDDGERPVPDGADGQLIIGGVGLGRYLDERQDAEMYAAMPALGWSRAYRTGDRVRREPAGLIFLGRADDQVKIGGRRIELGEVDEALLRLNGVVGAAATVRTSPAGTPLLVGYVVPARPKKFDRAVAARRLRKTLPSALVPVLAIVDDLPTRRSGKVDRDALPWPLPGLDLTDGSGHDLTGTEAWLAGHWAAVLGLPVTGRDDDFFAHGGGSLSAARLVSLLRVRFPQMTVGDIYRRPRLTDLAALLDATGEQPLITTERRTVRPTPRHAQLAQLAVTVVVATISGLQWVTGLALLNALLDETAHRPWAPTLPWWVVLLGAIVFLSPFGRMAIAVAGARLLLRGVGPGEYPRGGAVHLRLWTAERLADAVGAVNLAGAPWISLYARALGARVGRGVDLHAVPPITGLMSLGAGCAIEPEVDLAGYWLDADVLRIGTVVVGVDATVGARSTLGPNAFVGNGTEVEPGSFVTGPIPAGERWSGAPARAVDRAGDDDWPETAPPPGLGWLAVFGVTSVLFSLLPLLAAVPALLVMYEFGSGVRDGAAAAGRVLEVAPLCALIWFAALTMLFGVAVRLLGIGLRPGVHAVRSRVGWQVWAVERLMDAARTLLFPLYSSLATPLWLRALGAEVGREVEASTVLLQPKMTSIADGAFLADDTMVASYELSGGWLRIGPVRVGRRGFLGNSGMAGPGRAVPKDGLVAVLSAAPVKAKKGSSWLGSPPVRLRRSPDAADQVRTFAPSRSMRFARAAVELCRLIPTVATVVIGVGVLTALDAVAVAGGFAVAAAVGGVVLLAAGAVAALLTVAAKWLLVGRYRSVHHPLWSGFVWRTEVVDTFVEMVAAPWFARGASGTGALNAFLRALGARIGRGVWCESYWLPEADLVSVGEGATVNRGCVVQTHLFHDRIMRMDRVELGPGSALGPHSVILPAATLGAGAVIGPASLVMRGEVVPPNTRWIGNPIEPWPGPAA